MRQLAALTASAGHDEIPVGQTVQQHERYEKGKIEDVRARTERGQAKK